MRFLPDFKRTVTGYVWLDHLTGPYWSWRENRARRRLYRLLGQGNEDLGELIFRKAVLQSRINRNGDAE